MVFLVLFAAFIVHDYISYRASSYGLAVVFMLAAAIIAVGVVSVRWGLAVFVVALVFADDISRVDPLGGGLSSILTVSAGGVAVGNVIALALVAFALFFGGMWLSRQPRALRPHRVDACILGVLGVYALATLHGHSHWSTNLRGVINDLNLPIMLAGMYYVTRWAIQTPRRIALLWKLLIAVCAAKAVGWLLYFLLGIGFQFGSTLKISNESGRVILILVFAWGLVIQERDCPVSRTERMLGLLWAAAAGIGLLVQSQRGPWLMTAFAFIVLLVLGRLRDKIRWLLAGGVAVIVTFTAVSYLLPDAFDTIRFHASTLRFWDPQHLESSESTQIRIYEFKNIHDQLIDHHNVVLGEGPGSTFSDNYHQFPFGIFPGDYEWQEIESRKFQNPHGLLQNLMLNVGYGGMAVYLGLIGIIYWNCFVLVRKSRDEYLRAIALTLLAFLPAIVYNSWSPKNNMLLGILLGLIGATWSSQMAADAPAARDTSPEPDLAAPAPSTPSA